MRINKPKRLNSIALSTVVAAVLSACGGGGSCAGCAVPSNSSQLIFVAPSILPSLANQTGINYMGVYNPSTVAISGIKYSVGQQVGSGNSITLDAASAAACANIAAKSSCYLKFSVPESTIAGGTVVTATNSNGAEAATPLAIGVQQVLYTESANANGVGLYFYPTAQYSESGVPFILVTAVVQSPNVGTINTIELVDEAGNVIPNQVVISNNAGPGSSPLQMGDVVEIALPLPQGVNLTQNMKVQTSYQTLATSIASSIVEKLNLKSKALNATTNSSISTAIYTLTTQGNNINLQLTPNQVYLTQKNPIQYGYLYNIGDLTASQINITSSSPNVRVTVADAILNGQRVIKVTYELINTSVAPTTNAVLVTGTNPSGQTQTTTGGTNQNVAPDVVPTPTPSPGPGPEPTPPQPLTVSVNQAPVEGGSCSTVTATVTNPVSVSTIVSLAVGSVASSYGFAASAPYLATTTCTITTGNTSCSTTGETPNNLCAAASTAGTVITIAGSATGYTGGEVNTTVSSAPVPLGVLTVSPLSVNLDGNNLTQTITLSNSSSGTISNLGLPTLPSALVYVSNSSCKQGMTLPPLTGTCSYTISYSTLSSQTYGSTTISYTYNDGSTTQTSSNVAVSWSAYSGPMWTWMGGANTTGAYGTYGTKGTPSTSNIPGARNYSGSVVDKNGNFWLFGGFGNTAAETNKFINDLWKYNPIAGEWTWVSGASTGNQLGTYGTKGVGNILNVPGARLDAAIWLDSNNNIWLFGGYGCDSTSCNQTLNDLWTYSLSTGIWTWISGANVGTQAGVYGTKGTPSTSNIPGSRYPGGYWIDSNDNLWVFGGTGYDSTGTGYPNQGALNDLWRYDPTTNQWTWMNGNNTHSQPAVFGTTGALATSNTPGGQYYGLSSWIDSSNNLWLFVGYGYNATGNGNLNEMWKYNPNLNQWAFVSGTQLTDQFGVYGTLGVASTSNTPGGRSEYTQGWVDANGMFWLFGGYGYASSGGGGNINDLWKYNPNTNEWTWVSGADTTNQAGNYGSLGVANPSNVPGARSAIPNTWVDSAGNLWLFGGYGTGLQNDLWMYGAK